MFSKLFTFGCSHRVVENLRFCGLTIFFDHKKTPRQTIYVSRGILRQILRLILWIKPLNVFVYFNYEVSHWGAYLFKVYQPVAAFCSVSKR